MKSLIIIWLVVLAVVVGGSAYMNHAIGQMIEEMPAPRIGLVRGSSIEVVQSTDSVALQPAGAVYEDETTATMIVQPADYSKQTTKHYWFLQPTKWRFEVTYDVSLAEDVTLSNGVKPLVVQGSVYNVQGVRF